LAHRILIAGMNPFDSGKTELSIRLVKALTTAGNAVEYFKPISGHNYWLHHQHTQTCLERGMLVSKDATRVRQAYESGSSLLLSNPVHALYTPASLDKPLKMITNTLALAGWSSVLVMERFSRPTNGSIDTTMLVADNLVENEEVILTHEEVGKLSHGASIVQVDSLEEVQEFERQNFERHVTDSLRRVERDRDVVVIEGFNDAAWPFDGLEKVDTLLVTGPGHVYIYNPDKFRQAAYMMNRGNLPIREVTFGRVADLLRPLGLHRLTPDTELTAKDLEELGLGLPTRKSD
jgi:predicted P-loop ATPase/GTPase